MNLCGIYVILLWNLCYSDCNLCYFVYGIFLYYMLLSITYMLNGDTYYMVPYSTRCYIVMLLHETTCYFVVHITL